MDVYLIAKLAGNSVTIIQKFYDRHDVMQRAEELQGYEARRFNIEPTNLDILDL